VIDKKQLIEEGKEQGIEISEKEAESLDAFFELLIDWNNKINLTSIVDPNQAVTKHFIDSLLLNLFIKADVKRLVDIGAGGGFPSIPVSIVRPEIEITQLESIQKKIRFLEDAKDKLSLSTNPISIRAEEAGRKEEFREKFDIATARAVADLTVLSEYALPLVKVGGYFIPLKGPSGNEELAKAKKAIKELGGLVERVEEFELADGGKRVIPIIKKISHTPTRYPRNSAKIAKKPLFFPE